jgi:hypothetical protein
MPAKAIRSQLFEVFHQAGTQRIEVNVSDKLKQIGIFFTQDGLVAVLKELTVPAVAAIESDRIPRKHSSYDTGNRDGPCSEEEVGMVWNQRPSITWSRSARKDVAQSIEERFPIFVIPEDPPSFNPP